MSSTLIGVYNNPNKLRLNVVSQNIGDERMDWIKEFLIASHSWIVAMHIIAMVCWFAALFYLPRLFVYHSMSDDRISNERFKTMERKLYRGIANPSMVITISMGIALFCISSDYYKEALWFQIKIFLVILLVIYHYICQKLMSQFRDDNNVHGHIFYRWFNEAPVIILVSVVILVVVKPFS
jgi:protoporphyrinogen IX oxidase|tara:strand:+ start:6577 stop:7119 length:543 start_codon:yes stop_codon:yes gene_type:complete